ncbi:hypothetical protein ACFYY3_30340 [Streptomyces sp. NPDC001812]|uniref:DUF3592 domain-containing protein n=1 Tax=Streptomyces cathayae TaxID=3031124 RepID=A0ABY8K5I9_9ACTN|nr:hypothetical protein [Streptomyces sp. HUAS 5]WGD42025.1 hypothetical protein PYS65_18680 [Streptomyces sp. HUAS 5]
MTKERGLTITVYSMIAVLCAAATVWTVITGLARLDLLGNAMQVQITECHREDGARNTSHTVCSGPQVGTDAAHTVKVRYDGHSGEVVRVRQKPWGSYEAVETGLVSWGIWVLMPVLPLMGTAAAGAFTVREIRRARYGTPTGSAT